VSVVANVAINIDGKQAQSLLKAIQGEVEKLNGSFEHSDTKKKLAEYLTNFQRCGATSCSSAIGQLAAITGAAVTCTASIYNPCRSIQG
jgi:hypothetical protein